MPTLTNLKIFNTQVYRLSSELLREQVNLFNAATGNAIRLYADPIQGSFHETAFFANLEDVLRHRDPFTNEAIDSTSLGMLAETAVKIARGTKEIYFNNAEMDWIKKDPSSQAAVIAQNIAQQQFKDMLYTAISGLKAFLEDQPEVYLNSTDPISWRVLNKGQFKFGDARSLLRLNLMHSLALEEIYDDNLQNPNSLFSYETVNVIRDPFGRTILAVDAPPLIEVDGETGDATAYNSLMLTQDAVNCTTNADWVANEQTKNGYENILTSYQAQWSWNLRYKGASYVQTQGRNPTDAQIASAASWERVATDHKNLPGVMITTPVRTET